MKWFNSSTKIKAKYGQLEPVPLRISLSQGEWIKVLEFGDKPKSKLFWKMKNSKDMSNKLLKAMPRTNSKIYKMKTLEK